MHFDPQQLNTQQCYQLLVGAVVPRPIAWISTVDANGASNLAPYSFFTVASVVPPVLAVTQVNPRDRREKDTLRNLRATGECVVNIVGFAQVEAMNASCADYPPGISEIDALAIHTVASECVQPPGVAEAPVRFECRLRDVIRVGEQPSSGSMMLLDVVGIAVAEHVWRDGRISAELLDAIGKLGGDAYTLTRERFELARPVLTMS